LDNRPWKILLVEDDEDDYILTLTMLHEVKRGQFELIWAETYSAALKRLNEANLDVVLVDYRLDTHNGLDFVREAMRRGLKAPIIVFTGQDSYEVDVEAMKIGAVDYLVKGQISGALLERTIRYAIEHKQSEEALQQARDELEQRVLERTRELADLNEELRAEILERKRAEESAKASETKFRKLAESTSTAIFIVQGMKIRYANNAAQFITGYLPNRLIDMDFCEIAHPAYQEILLKNGIAGNWNYSKEDGTNLLLPARYEMRLLKPDGEERWVDVTAGAIEFEGEQAWIVTAFDITERDMAEQALRKAKDELEVRVVERTAELQQANQRLLSELQERKRIAEERERLLIEIDCERQRVEELARRRERYLARLDALIQVSKKILAETTLEGLLQQISDAALELTGVKIGVELTSRDGQPDGLFMDSDIHKSEFEAEDEALMTHLATLASLGLQHIQARAEAETRADELDTVFSSMVDIVIVYDEKGIPVRANPAAEEIYGFNPIGQDPNKYHRTLDIRYPNGKVVDIEHLPFRRTLAGETVEDKRLIFTDNAGRKFTYLVSSAPIKIGGKVTGAVSVWHDVTKSEQLLVQLESERTMLSTMISNAPVAITVTDDEGYVVISNPVAEKLYRRPIYTGLNLLNLEGINFYEATGDPYSTRENPMVSLPLSRQTSINQELSLKWRDGLQRFFLVNSTPILNRQNMLQGAVTIFQDITERKQVEVELRMARDELEQRVEERTRALAKANEELRGEILERKRAEELVYESAARTEALAEISRQLVEAGPDFELVLNLVARNASMSLGDWCVIRIISEDNRRLELASVYHKDPDALSLLQEILPNISSEVHSGVNGEVFYTGQPVLLTQVTQEWIESNGMAPYTPYYERFGAASLMIVPILDQGKLIGTLGLVRDGGKRPYTHEDLVMLQSLSARTALTIANVKLYKDLETSLQKEQTMRRQLVQAEKHSAISRMVASVAHELNNPVQTIQNCLFLTTQDIPTSSPIHEYLDMALSETRRVSKLVSQLREIYRPAKAEPMQSLNLLIIAEEVKTLLLPHLQHKKVTWAQSADLQEIIVAGIPDQIKQVFLNICLNAIEAMQPEGGCLNVDISLLTERNQVCISFSDTGPGISQENLAKLFEPFFTTKESGIGLGLSICYDIIDRHLGEITVDSEMGVGSTFTVWLPLSQAN
jgi:PAS domain S-box-containing protein